MSKPDSERQKLLALVRICVREKAKLRFERFASEDDVRDFLVDLRRDPADLKGVMRTMFAGPEWTFDSLWTASRYSSGKRRRLIRLYRLTKGRVG